MGAACSGYQEKTIRGIKSRRLQCDEIWSFVGAKAKNVSEEKKAEGCGDCWTWTALDVDTKLMISFRLGDRTLATAYDFVHDLADRIANRIQLMTDGYKVYLEAVDSPAKYIGCTTQTIAGTPDPKHVSTSFVERQNLTMRMSKSWRTTRR